MSLRSLVMATLKDIGVPVRFITYSGDEDTYILFYVYTVSDALSMEDEETFANHYVQISIFTKDPTKYSELEKEVKSRLKRAGFFRSNEQDLYENETELFHKVLRYGTTLNTEEE
ncbi:hypothetical protein EI976_20325 [Bacillus licheniformis]|jgi:hypothetical protein|uniref:Phage related protein n=3 Tax=Bacillus licheniformis TaxID=1402 RepID=Q65KF9_BACLD|nr:phage related protein [Bacillus licheniformis DSM 13 = ATCC 14580]AUZ30276.1 hypothetical protein C1T27_07945 [Bacillus licheniformis]MBC9090077.1 hypothetical protein [Bacillus sp. Y1]NBB46260.1 hypothetical protein [Bacillus sp. y1(2019)]NYV81426.1 hypothetical protein [Bacillus sp. Gen2]